MAEGGEGRQLLVLVQNLQKKSGLGGELVRQYVPDIMLAQEISSSTESEEVFQAQFTSRAGYGTAIHCARGVEDVRRVKSPHAEVAVFVKKKTTIALCDGVWCVSFHGYNGSLAWRTIQPLVDHVQAALEEVPRAGPAVFAGDFNTWSGEHLAAVSRVLSEHGFEHALSWEYPGRDHPLDHAFLRSARLLRSETIESAADHRGALMTIQVDTSH